jgi:hypothetical protein
MNVALDLEEVLADTIHEACNSTDSLDESDFQTWGLDTRTWQVYSGVSDALWRHDPLSIPTVEPKLSENTQTLWESSNRLDIVTARLHVDDQIEEWLEYHEIYYDNLVSTSDPKYELSYDVYIDDNPEMHGNCRLLLRHHPHNESVDTTNSKMSDKVMSLGEAVWFVQ